MWTKLLLLVLFALTVTLIVWRVQAFIRQKNAQVTSTAAETGFFRSTPSSGAKIHLLFHLYRGNPDVLARSVFGAFEAAKYPQLVHVHVYQELCGADRHTSDVYATYETTYAHRHSWDTSKTQVSGNIHIVNENPSQSAGYFVSLLTLAQESVEPVLGPDDVVLVPQAFYDSPGTVHLFPLTFAQDYDECLRAAHLNENSVYSGQVPRTSLSATSANQVTALTSSLSQAIGNSLVVPFLRAKENGHFLESRAPNTCSASACANLAIDQAGFPSFTTTDRAVHVRVRQNTSSDVPFTVFRFLRDSWEGDWETRAAREAASIVRPVPIVGIHEDMVVCRAAAWFHLVRFAHGSGRRYLVPGPAYIQTLIMSNMMHACGLQLESMNHLPVVAVFDHLTGAAATVDPVSLKNMKEFRPHNWKVALRPAHRGSEQMVPVKLDDASDVLCLDRNFEWYAGVFPDNVTQDGFLGLTGADNQAAVMHKYGSSEELARQKRMMDAIEFPVKHT